MGHRGAREAMEEARRARLGTRGAQPPLGSTASCALAHGSTPRGPGARWLPMGQEGTGAARASLPGCFALALPCAARPAPRAWPASPERRRAP